MSQPHPLNNVIIRLPPQLHSTSMKRNTYPVASWVGEAKTLDTKDHDFLKINEKKIISSLFNASL